MNKALKIIGGILLALVVIYFIAALLGPKHFRTERSTVIHASPHTIFGYIADYHQWPLWSPFHQLDTTCQYEYFGQPGQADAGYHWRGNSKAGEGEMRTIEIAQDLKLTYRINFIKPMAGEAHATFTLDTLPGGDTKVTWTFEEDVAFLVRPMGLVFSMEKMIGGFYETGLAKLKALAEAPPATGEQAIITVQLPSRTYIAYRLQTSTDSVGALFPRWMPKVYEYVQAHKLEMDGAPAGLYYTWDPEHKKTDMAIAIPVKKADRAEAPYTLLTVPATKAVMAHYYGPYNEKMAETHALLGAYITDMKLKKKGLAIESYETDPGTEKDPNKVLTDIYYPID